MALRRQAIDFRTFRMISPSLKGYFGNYCSTNAKVNAKAH